MLRPDWRSRLPLKLKNGVVGVLNESDLKGGVSFLGDVPIEHFTISPASRANFNPGLSADAARRPAFELVKIGVSQVASANLGELLVKLNAMPSVVFAEPNFKYRKIAVPNDPNFSVLWGISKISAPSAWDLSTGSASQIVAVLDTGIDLNHQDLKANIWTNTREIAGNGIDDDQNGYIDDVSGWDFANGDNEPSDVDGHGTHCAGTVAAVGNNRVGVVGVGWSTKIMPVKVLADDGWAFNFDIYNGILYAVFNGAKVLSNSYGGVSASALLATAIKSAQDNGVLFVAAAGNDSAAQAIYPAYYTKKYSNVLSVASTNDDDTLSEFSNYGDGVDVAAPGHVILSTAPLNSYVTMSGTSMATPHVAGTAALLWSVASNKSFAQIKAAIMTHSDQILSLTGKLAANGRINVRASLDSLLSEATPTPTAAPSPTPAPTQLYLSGLRYKLFRGSWKQLSQFDSRQPVDEGISKSIALKTFNLKSSFGASWQGYIWIEKEGRHTFYLKSDDGSRLTIGGESIVNNDGVHPSREKSGARLLTRGYHPFRLDYFQAKSAQVLRLQWKGPGFTRRTLDKSPVLFHR